MSDDRPKKSWREIDAGRDRSGQRSRRDPDQRSREKTESSAAYKKYKSQLDTLFTPGGRELPPALKEKLGPTTEEGKQRQALTQALLEKGDAPTLSQYLAAGLTLPEDARLLIRLLDIADTALLKPVLEALLPIVEAGQKPSRMLLIQKLDAIALRLGSGEIADLARQIRAEL